MAGGVALLGIGLMLMGGLMVLFAAFRESILWGLGSIVIPLVMLFFVATHWSESKRGFLIQLMGVALFVIGRIMAPGAAVEQSLWGVTGLSRV